jgi:hypothetical protein
MLVQFCSIICLLLHKNILLEFCHVQDAVASLCLCHMLRALRRPRRAVAADFFDAPPPPTSRHRRAAAAAADFLSARRRFRFRDEIF